ncbi:UDP-N-acetylmuramate--L-alanine ligase [Ornithinimicrobium pratense]|uniref:UDP-N-acetylmuramate--L-alanine ligase n=1 Tax=Ornithinimicrobium pratense TaxID=2593973 RepID=A0A5J6V4T6_9MICO|nr:UDP-N-acetylmuramate--L-alanine ligase [Ornithinimicrobium pratense]QFG68141.1 UDP-N-acetylmuramate--L-alanine ligase [Ornithinimicrobium pratense]
MLSSRFDFTAPVPPAEQLGPVHLIAIGGSGVSGVARMFLARGIPVSGSDRSDSPALRALEAEGARVHVGHDAAHLGAAQTVVISGAIREDNPELAAARAAGLRVLHRAQGIASLLAGRGVIAVAGANGKTTTSAMTTTALQAAGLEPGYVIGAPLASTGANAAPGGEGSPVVVEADESDGSFLAYRPDVAVVTNVQPDHLDFYGDLEALEQAYLDFVLTLRPGGLLVTHADDPGAARLAQLARDRGIRVLTWGEGADADVRLTDVASAGMRSSGTLTFTRTAGQVREGTTVSLALPVPGEHNVHNATAALLAAVVGVGAAMDRALAGLSAFAGAHRRLELVGRHGAVEVVDDYAHNAPKVGAAVRAARSAANGRRVVVAFQPHLFSRTRDFADGFAQGLAAADVAVLLPVYGAREAQEDYPDVTSGLLATLVRQSPEAPEVHEAQGLDDATRLLARLVEGRDDLVLTIGAGDVTEVGPRLLTRLAEGDTGHDEGGEDGTGHSPDQDGGAA